MIKDIECPLCGEVYLETEEEDHNCGSGWVEDLDEDQETELWEDIGGDA